VEATITAAKTRPEDAAAVELLRRYARLIDNAAPAGKYAKALDWLQNLRVDDKCEQFRLVIMVALAEHSVASDLGPKLLSTLEQLGATPSARSRLSARGVGATDAPPESAHDRMIRERDELAARRRDKAT
jgi:hypothetical protein